MAKNGMRPMRPADPREKPLPANKLDAIMQLLEELHTNTMQTIAGLLNQEMQAGNRVTPSNGNYIVERAEKAFAAGMQKISEVVAEMRKISYIEPQEPEEADELTAALNEDVPEPGIPEAQQAPVAADASPDDLPS